MADVRKERTLELVHLRELLIRGIELPVSIIQFMAKPEVFKPPPRAVVTRRHADDRRQRQKIRIIKQRTNADPARPAMPEKMPGAGHTINSNDARAEHRRLP